MRSGDKRMDKIIVMNLFLCQALVATVLLGYFWMFQDHLRSILCLLGFVLQGGPHLPFRRE